MRYAFVALRDAWLGPPFGSGSLTTSDGECKRGRGVGELRADVTRRALPAPLNTALPRAAAAAVVSNSRLAAPASQAQLILLERR